MPLTMFITKKGKQVKVNHLEQSRLTQYIGHLNVVLFAPEDLNIVKGSPSNKTTLYRYGVGPNFCCLLK